ncbi:phosphoesterase [Leptospira perolatii]|uniref:Phosphoesterase n=1 Tax=Leptospira perolatii TaxID=2023191 RepID=A0A2M9ZIF8_9LEPT|nr:metallophosphoesterase [Leptospira perolatii]PJZ68351.1 phosphoesterase [Leptospira perolatii]PJZ71839.1 phosphoesterase [Leptospira perolatii]
MRIIYLTDIHDGLTGLKEVLLRTECDLYLFSGDIIYKAFFNPERIIEFVTLQEEMYRITEDQKEEINPYDYATRAVRFPEKYDPAVVEKSHEYRKLFHQAAKTMKEKYELIEQLIQKYSKAPVCSLPGNYDIDLQYSALYERDLHRKTYELNGLKFAGYGGAPIITSGIPEKLAVKFHEYNRNGKNYSEPEDFFNEEKPDIVVIHNPAYGYLDRIPSFGHIGSQGIRRYLDENSPSLVVSGHVHEDQGIIKKGKTIFLNPSNFGPVDSVFGFQPGGFFSEIELENDLVKTVKLNRLSDRVIRTLIEVDCTSDKLSVVNIVSDSEVTAEDFVRQ